MSRIDAPVFARILGNVVEYKKDVELANLLLSYYTKRFGNDVSGLSYFKGVTFEDLIYFKNLLRNESVLQRYHVSALSSLIEFGMADDVHNAQIVHLPSMFILNELNKLILQSIGRFGNRDSLMGYGTIPLGEEGERIFNTFEFMVNLIAVKPDNIILPSSTIVKLQNSFQRMGISPKMRKWSHALMGCMFTAFSLYTKALTDFENYPVYIHLINTFSKIGTNPVVSDGIEDELRKLFGSLRLADVGRLPPLTDVSERSSHPVAVSYQELEKLYEEYVHFEDPASNRVVGSPRELKVALDRYNSIMFRVNSFKEKSDDWFLSSRAIATLDLLSFVEKPLIDVPGFVNPVLQDFDARSKIVPKKSQKPFGPLTAYTVQLINRLTSTWSRDRLTQLELPRSPLAQLLAVYMNLAVNGFYGYEMSYHAPTMAKHVGLRNSMQNAMAIMQDRQVLFQHAKQKTIKSSAEIVFQTFRAVWAADNSEVNLVSDISHNLFNLVICNNINWQNYIEDLALIVQKSLLARLENYQSNPLGQLGLTVLSQLENAVKVALNNCFVLQRGNITQRLWKWNSMASKLVDSHLEEADVPEEDDKKDGSDSVDSLEQESLDIHHV